MSDAIKPPQNESGNENGNDSGNGNDATGAGP
jgi:hypothetical protein